MKKLLRILKDRRGGSLILHSFIALCIFIVGLVCCERWHLFIVTIGVREALHNAVTTACTENYNRLYNGVREGYTGGYKLDGESWSEDIDTGDVYAKLDNVLGTRAEGGAHIKYSGSSESYSLSDLSVQMTNTPFAPNDPKSANKFTGVAYVTLRVPMGFNWGVPPMETRLKVTAGYLAKF